jgi:hypothetical protein
MEMIACAAFPTYSFPRFLCHNCFLASSGPGYGLLTASTILVTATETREYQLCISLILIASHFEP